MITFPTRPVQREECSYCYGTGCVTRSYALAAASSPIKRASRMAVHAVAVGCSSIFECAREAAELATLTRRAVAFDFNGRLVVVRKGDDPNAIARDWWKKTYKETPEQSAARR